MADDIETLALQIEDGAPDLDIDTIWQITRYLTACGYVSLARRDADIAAAKAAGVNEGIRLAARLVRAHALGDGGGRVADFLESRADRDALTTGGEERG